MAAPDLTGVLLERRYRLTRVLGAGGMGQVYEGMDETLECKVAVKVLLRKLADEERFRGRFLREAKAASKVRHPNVVKITDFGEHTDGSVFFVMEYLEGRDLQQLLRTEQRLPWARARHILLQIVSAIGATHDRNIVHRDIKPANFFLVDARGLRDFVKLLDFGIAKLATEPSEDDKGLALSLTGTGEVFGTAKYMAPEVAYGETKDPRIDIYAVGVVAYEMLTGRVPFEGSSVFEILKKHVDEPPRPPRELEPRIPAEVEAMVLRALAKKPADRFGSMDELEAAISAIPAEATAGSVTLPRGQRGSRLRRTVPLGPRETAEAREAGEAGEPGDGVPVPRSAVDTEPARAAEPSAKGAEPEETTNVAPRPGVPAAVRAMQSGSIEVGGPETLGKSGRPAGAGGGMPGESERRAGAGGGMPGESERRAGAGVGTPGGSGRRVGAGVGTPGGNRRPAGAGVGTPRGNGQPAGVGVEYGGIGGSTAIVSVPSASGRGLVGGRAVGAMSRGPAAAPGPTPTPGSAPISVTAPSPPAGPGSGGAGPYGPMAGAGIVAPAPGARPGPAVVVSPMTGGPPEELDANDATAPAEVPGGVGMSTSAVRRADIGLQTGREGLGGEGEVAAGLGLKGILLGLVAVLVVGGLATGGTLWVLSQADDGQAAVETATAERAGGVAGGVAGEAAAGVAAVMDDARTSSEAPAGAGGSGAAEVDDADEAAEADPASETTKVAEVAETVGGEPAAKDGGTAPGSSDDDDTEIAVDEDIEAAEAVIEEPAPEPATAKDAKPEQPKGPSKAECEELRTKAAAAKLKPDWKAVLSLTGTRACWSSGKLRNERKRLRVAAYAELGNYDRCVKEGGSSSDKEIKARVGWCQRRLSG